MGTMTGSTPGGSLQPGQVLQGRYLILGILGQGGMGAVYQARDLRFAGVTRLCAVKEMINLALDQDMREEAMRSFEREAEILATLSHPAIPQIFDYFSFGDRSYLVQELIVGTDLQSLMGKAPGLLPFEDVCGWAINICDVLSYLHNYQPEPIIFRDMKPSNIMIDQHHRVRLIDFGIARTFQPNTRVTSVGTQGYAPPELYDGRADGRSDIYSLGATLHHLLTRTDPQISKPFSFDERPIAQFNPAVPDAFVAAVARALNINPDERYASAEAMKQALIASLSINAMNTPTRTDRDATNHDKQQRLNPASTVEPIWVFHVEDAVRSGPLVRDGVVYVGSCDNNLWALDAHLGSMRWKFATQGPIDSSPICSGGTVVVGSADHNLYAVDIRTGHCAWRFKTEGEIHSRPAAALGLVLVGSDDGRLYGVKPGAAGASKIWDYNVMSPIQSSPIVEKDRVFFGSDKGEYYCLGITGNEIWRFTGRHRIEGTALIKNNMIYFGSGDKAMHALDVDHPLVNWRFQTHREVIAGAAFSDNKVLFGSTDGQFYALNSRDGSLVWRYNVGEPIRSAPFAHGEAVYFGATNGAVYCLNVQTGHLVWRYQTKGPVNSTPGVADGIVYVGSDDGHVYALPA